eukprot:gene21880-27955_t
MAGPGHLITVPAGVSPVNALLSSAVMHGEGAAAMMGGGMGGADGGGGGDFDMYGGIDPAMDPELAMAIRVSTEEARAEEEARVKALQEQTTSSSSSSSSGASGSSGGAEVAFGGYGAVDEDDEEALIRQALEMSMMDVHAPSTSAESVPAVTSSTAAASSEEDDEEAELRLALQLSVGTSDVPDNPPPSTDFLDADFVNQLLGSGDHDDPLIQAALAQMGGGGAKGGPPSGESEEDKSKKRKGDDL